jgi:hypothetical protein
MFKNKHMTTAMVVAPLLAIVSYFATDYIVSDIPETAAQGESYAMVARSNCRYQSGQCTFRNGDLEVKFQLVQTDGSQPVLKARSNHPLQGAQIALVGEQNKDAQPLMLEKSDDAGEQWAISLQGPIDDKNELRVAMLANSTTFYGSTETTFFQYDTIFPRDDW